MTGKNKDWYQAVAKQIGILSWSILLLKQLVRAKTNIYSCGQEDTVFPKLTAM